jgi:hypothetical protein
MQNLIPHFQYSIRGDHNNYGYIVADGELIHWIKNLGEFYKALGYLPSMAMEGIMPDEFIWDKYIKVGAANSTTCMQMNIIEYLSKYSDNFRKKYSDRYKSWIATDAKPENNDSCFSCDMKPFCSDTLSKLKANG